MPCREVALATNTAHVCLVNLQEADLQRYRTHLISMGKIENAAGANLKPRRHKTFEESIKAFEVGHISVLCQTFTDTKLQTCSSFAYCHTLLLQSICAPPCDDVSKFEFVVGAGLT